MILQKASPEEQKQLLEVIKFEEFLLNVIRNVPKRIMRENTNLDPPLHIELRNISNEEFRQKLLKQKGEIAYHIIRQRINGKMINQERKDLELIEKELGELFIKQPPSFRSVEKIKTIFGNLKVDEQLRDGKFHLLEKDTYLSQLRQIKNLSKPQSIEKENWNSLIKQTETVIKTIQAFGQTDKEIDKMLINQELLILKSIISKLSNEEQQQEQKSQDPMNENYRTYLQLMIKIVKIKTLSLQEEMELLNELFEKVLIFAGKLDQIQRYEEENQTKFQNRFQEFIQECIGRFEKSQLIEEDQNFCLNKESLEFQLFKRGNDNTQIKISDFLQQLVVSVQKNWLNSSIAPTPNSNKIFQFNKYKKYTQRIMKKKMQKYQKNKLVQFKSSKTSQIMNNGKSNKVQCLLQFRFLLIVFQILQLLFVRKSQSNYGFRKRIKESEIFQKIKILQKDWQTQHDRIEGKMQEMLRRIDELQEQISHEANLNKRDQYLKELDETTEQLDQQIENISEMGQQLRLLTDFVNHIRKGLIRVEGKINEMKEQLKSIGNDIKFLRGKSVEQLFEIRKWKVLKEAALKNAKSIYRYSHKGEKKEDKLSILINLEQIDDTNGEVNEFLLEEHETVLLIHGVAGSGKSTTAKKIEEFIWKLHNNNKKIRNQILIPVYISLPSLKNPVFQAVEEALHQDEYGFDELQLRECKEKLEKKEFRLLLIMDSYDEMKLENIQKNLYMNNKVKQNWSDPLVIFTTRSEIFTSSNYTFWFAPDKKENLNDNKDNLKEIQLQKFNPSQIMEQFKVLKCWLSKYMNGKHKFQIKEDWISIILKRIGKN
ncbi:unnamed protein product (macronuclear) [Paramecium tetraurelia]|uniref:NB-ARC domain-containing protein n=1 Tax=Paramecium tetraurelia TaxID=5888 RepID=A0DCQ1_PARTE|nr:uncharacterized protein GSPATT00039409001 [Paramecium tetraurelia]CAK80818.1 unnamed protein product [Paramecium tetraurelia]|eukprot:XP_001448215.1 hypothetical protein (macronuclear) [Paramecium tetraurelia strain d4-2]